MNPELINASLIKNGYYVGTFDDFFNTGVSKLEFDDHVKTYFELVDTMYKNKSYVYRHNYSNQHTTPSIDPARTHEDKADEVLITRAQHRKEYVQSLIDAGVGTRTTQQWGRFEMVSPEGLSEDLLVKGRAMDKFLHKLTINHAAKVYPDLNPESNITSPQYSIYENDDFSELHYDGYNPNVPLLRPTWHCVIIMYLSDPSSYTKETDGHLFIDVVSDDPNSRIYVEPVYGTYVMLDFTKFNLGHGISKLHGDFKRLTYQCFVGPTTEQIIRKQEK